MNDYTDLIHRLRNAFHDQITQADAADAIEALLAEQKTLNERMMQMRNDSQRLLVQIDTLKDVVAAVQRERDTLIEQNKALFDSALLAGQERDAARRAALEEAAKMCEEIVPYLNEVRYGNVKRQCAAAIRALIESDDA